MGREADDLRDAFDVRADESAPWSRPARVPWLDTMLVVLAVGALYLALRQDAVYRCDGNAMMRSLTLAGGSGGYAHFGYFAVLHALYALVGPDQPLYGQVQALSSIAAALAAGVSHRACATLGLDRGAAFLAAAGAASSMSCVQFATVFEIHAVFLLPAACAWWALARLVVRPGFAAVVPLGIATGVATAVHYSGAVLPLLGALALWSAPSAPYRPRRVALLGAWLLLHGATFGLLFVLDHWLLRSVDARETFGFALQGVHYPLGLRDTGRVVWQEWVLPFAPWSVGFLWAWRRPPLRRAVLAMCAAVLGYLAMDLLTLRGWCERGAYALPLALPAAALCATAARPRWLVLGITSALAVALWNQGQQDVWRVPAPGFGRSLHHWHRAHPGTEFVLGGYAEVDSVLVFAPPTLHRTVFEPPFARWLQPQTSDEAVRSELTAYVEGHAGGEAPLVFSAEAMAALQSLPRNRAILDGLAATFAFEDVGYGAFRGVAVFRRR